MKRSKRLLALGMLIIFALATIFTACTSQTAQDEPKPADEPKAVEEPKSETTEKVEVDVFQFKVEIAQELEKAAKEYEAANPNVKINIQTVCGGDDYGAALRAKFQSGSEPDIYNVGGPQDIKDWMNKSEDLSDQPWVDLALEGVLSGATVDGKVYALPFNIEGYGFVYNKAIFADAGIDVSVFSLVFQTGFIR